MYLWRGSGVGVWSVIVLLDLYGVAFADRPPLDPAHPVTDPFDGNSVRMTIAR